MPELVSSVEVDAPPEAMWAAATDWPRHGRWMLATTVRPRTPGGPGVGARIEGRTGAGRLGLRDPMTITAWAPPRRCVVRHDGPVVRGAGAFLVDPLPGGRSRFTWAEWFTPPLGVVGQVGFRLLRPAAALFLRVSLRRLARWAPTRSPG